MTKAGNYNKVQITGLLLSIFVFLIFKYFSIIPENIIAERMAAIAIIMAILWITEAVPLGVTSLIPVIMFPILGISEVNNTASEYFNSTMFLFLGGFFIAIAMETWNLHKRISLIIIKAIGSGTSGLILGFMAASAFLSMFISNTATTIMMLPIGIAVIIKFNETYKNINLRNFQAPLMLGIAYGSSLGGIATLIGTVPNLVFIRIYRISFPNAPEISFGNWMLFAVPVSIIMLIIIWLLMTKILFRIPEKINIDKNIIREEYKALGRMSYEEKVVLIIFLITGILWIFRQDMNLGWLTVPGWSGLLYYSKFIDDSTVAIFMAFILFLIPSKSKNNPRLLTSASFKKIPWEIMILFGGGFALANGFQTSGLSELLGNQFAGLSGIPPIILIAVICLIVTFLTELTSNTATAQTLLPILASAAVGMKINPLILMIPATISVSFAFMLPVATPPNAIVFGTGKIKISEMVRTGFIINLIGVLLVTLLFYFLGYIVFGINIGEFPDWAAK